MVKLLHDKIELCLDSTFFVEEHKQALKSFVGIHRWLNLPSVDPNPEMQLIICRLQDAAIDATLFKNDKKAVLNIASNDPVKEREQFIEALAFFIKAYPPKHLQTERDHDNLYMIAELLEGFTKLSYK